MQGKYFQIRKIIYACKKLPAHLIIANLQSRERHMHSSLSDTVVLTQ